MVLTIIQAIRTKKQRILGDTLLYNQIKINYTLISTSTPLGSSSFIRASTVLAVEL